MNIKNKFVSLLGGSLFVTTSFMPIFAGAQMRNEKMASTSTRPAAGGGFCNAITERVSSMQKQFSDMKGKLGERKTDRKDNLEKRWGDYLNNLNGGHDKQARELSGSVEKLNKRATTDIQKAAVEIFRQAMQAALAARKTAVAASLKTFHDGVAAALEAKKSSLANALKTATDAITAAGDKAKADCASGADAKTVRTAFMSGVQSARSNFNSARKQDDMSSQMKQLTAAKNAALKKRQDDFHTAVVAARDALKGALG